MFSSSARVATSRATAQCVMKQQKRTMAGGGPKPEWTGIDKTVRNVFPEDWQLAGAILGGYSSLIALAMVRSAVKGSPPPAPVVAAPAAAPSSGIPSVESDDFAAFLDTEAFATLIDSEEQLAAALAE